MCRFIVIERTKNTFLFVEEVNRVLFGEVQLNGEEQFCCSDRSFVCLFVYGTLSIDVFINYFNFVIFFVWRVDCVSMEHASRPKLQSVQLTDA